MTLHGNESFPSLPPPEIAYLANVVDALQEQLDRRLIGVYLFGSGAYGDYLPGHSDLDVQSVVVAPLPDDEKRSVARALSQPVLPCPARRLEFVCYAADAINPAQRYLGFELNFNTGPAEPDHLTMDPAEEASHWFLLDIAVGRELGKALYGPPPAVAFAPIPRTWQLEAILDSLSWHEGHEATSVNSILNACRGWRYAATGAWGSKVEGARWALGQPGCTDVVRAALDRRDPQAFDPGQVAQLIDTVREVVSAQLL